MFKLLTRFVFFVIGVMLLLDTGLPTRVDSVQVDGHTSSQERSTSNGFNARWADTSYTLHLIGGRVASCSVGYATYGRLKDGDAIEVKATKLFRTCLRISKGDEVLESDTYWRIFALIGGCLFIAAAFGWVQTDDEGSFRFS